ncbi:beta-ketoacyl synthase chain length factor [Mucilaginibacter sp. dw_454]|uniref:beta-ketoacyl synthase chain length factor n=1 Tax=Mucilaginibacter sp. dw_454 TaxID=2720079 RepID=UPI001BD3283E|nr:beta-ketoacyl synthase chain length factor [Mucilaginibacter sp. dw_454]
MKAYIRSTAAITAQKTFGDVPFLTELTEYNGTRLTAIEPDYKEYVDPKMARRMSRMVKMGITAALQCLQDGQIEMPDAIITGTALGCQEDTIAFLTRIIELDEEMLPPTAFIQSTHNTVTAQIALSLKCHGYNNTFVHKGVSFESSLLDAMMLLNEGDANQVLVGGTEEMTDTAFKVLTRLGLYKRWPLSNADLYKTRSNGTIGGEGSIFFLLNHQPSPDNLAELIATKTFYKPKTTADVELNIREFLTVNAINIEEIDLVITGKNGDTKNDEVYENVIPNFFANNSMAKYKHLCGEYPVSTSFALWLAANIVKRGEVPALVADGEIKISSPKKILIYNHYQNSYHSLMLVSAC